MSRQSNIILTNENNIIIDSIKHFDTNTREMLPAHEYEFVPITKKSFLSIKNSAEFIELINNEKTNLSKSIPNLFIGFSKTLVKYFLQKLNIDDANYNNNELENLFNELSTLINNIGTKEISCTQFGNDFTLTNRPTNVELQINNFIDEYYFSREVTTNFQSARNNLLHIVLASLKKITKKL